jgi:hypothetical protein
MDILKRLNIALSTTISGIPESQIEFEYRAAAAEITRLRELAGVGAPVMVAIHLQSGKVHNVISNRPDINFNIVSVNYEFDVNEETETKQIYHPVDGISFNALVKKHSITNEDGIDINDFYKI